MMLVTGDPQSPAAPLRQVQLGLRRLCGKVSITAVACARRMRHKHYISYVCSDSHHGRLLQGLNQEKWEPGDARDETAARGRGAPTGT